MKKILVVDATGRTSEKSKTKFLSETMLEKINIDSNQITKLNLYEENIPYVTQDILDARISGQYDTLEQKRALEVVEQFEASDVIIFIYPVWNWSIPAILKTYIDLIMISKRNFTYKGMKIVGLLEGKKAVFISTGGGPLLGKLSCKLFGMDNPTLYMKKLMKILGITETKSIVIGGVSYKFKNKEKNLNFDFELFKKFVEDTCEKRKTEIKEFIEK